MLLVVVLTLALAAVVVTPLAMLSGVSALTVTHRAATLRHRLAADSVIALLPELLECDRRLNQDLGRFNRCTVTLTIGKVHVHVLLQDDTAKLPMPLLFDSRSPTEAHEALMLLQAGANLPRLELSAPSTRTRDDDAAALPWAGCLDDLFTSPTDAALFGTPDACGAWTQYITPLGDAVHLDRAHPAVLAAALADLEPGLGHRMAELRKAQSGETVDGLLSGLELPERLAQEARRRLTLQSQCYSLLIRTTIEDDTRQRSVICAAEAVPGVLVDWEVAP